MTELEAIMAAAQNADDLATRESASAVCDMCNHAAPPEIPGWHVVLRARLRCAASAIWQAHAARKAAREKADATAPVAPPSPRTP